MHWGVGCALGKWETGKSGACFGAVSSRKNNRIRKEHQLYLGTEKVSAHSRLFWILREGADQALKADVPRADKGRVLEMIHKWPPPRCINTDAVQVEVVHMRHTHT